MIERKKEILMSLMGPKTKIEYDENGDLYEVLEEYDDENGEYLNLDNDWDFNFDTVE